MLNEHQYRALRAYLDGSLPVPENVLSEDEKYLLSKGYIEPDENEVYFDSIQIGIETKSHKITPAGIAALNWYEEEQHKQRQEKRRAFILHIIVAVASALVGALATKLLS